MLQTKLEEQVQDNFSNYDNIETMLSEMKTDREDVNEGKPRAIEDESPPLPPEETTTINQPEVIVINGPKRIPAQKAKFESRFLARQNDRVNAFLCSLIANEDPDNFKADQEDIDEIAEYLYEWRKDSQEPLPVWLEVAIGIALVYGPKYKEAFALKKEKKRSAGLEDEKLRLQEESAAQQKQILDLLAEKAKIADDGKKED